LLVIQFGCSRRGADNSQPDALITPAPAASQTTPSPSPATFARELAAIAANPKARKPRGDVDRSPDPKGRRMASYGFNVQGLIACSLDVMEEQPAAWEFWVVAPSTQLTQFAPATAIHPIVKTQDGQWYELTEGPLRNALLFTTGNDNFHVASRAWVEMKNVDLSAWFAAHRR